MAGNSQKDREALLNAFRHDDPVPRFHYEMRSFAVIQCCYDIGDNDLELVVVAGHQYALPSGYAEKDMDTYVKYELPFPAVRNY